MSRLHVLDERDLAWIGELVDVVEAAAGQPWRVALDRLDGTHQEAPRRFAAAVAAVQRILGGRARNARLARAARSLVLGAPALTAAEREARIAFAASELDCASATVERLLWSDLPRERPVELPHGRPSEFEVAAHANVQLIQRAMARAQSIRMRVAGDAGPLIRATSSRGLLATISIDGADTVLDVLGPLALFHRTAVYGRALGSLVPLLAGCPSFEVDMHVQTDENMYRVELASPVLLPPVPARMAVPNARVARLVRELRRIDREIVAIADPPAIAAGSTLVCPDLVLRRGDRRIHVELLGFWTTGFVARKRTLYEAAGITDVVLGVDTQRACGDEAATADARIVPYGSRLRVLAEQLVALAAR